MTELQILYSDEHIAVVCKPQGTESEHEMPKLIASQLGCEAYPVHRLDRDAGGLMVYALNRFSAAQLTKQIGDRTFEKYYLAVVLGTPDPATGAYEDFLFHDRQKNKTYVVSKERKGVKLAKLEYNVLGTENTGSDVASLVKIHLLTGRTHQIRVQFASRKMPLHGDSKYGGKRDGAALALWSYQLCFLHPKSKKSLSYTLVPPQTSPWNLFEM